MCLFLPQFITANIVSVHEDLQKQFSFLFTDTNHLFMYKYFKKVFQ
jgi:hypothetical protein